MRKLWVVGNGGKVIPYPYFRQQLCALFGKTAEQLGLLADTTVEDAASLGIQCTAPKSRIPASFLADPTILLSLQSATSLVGHHGVLMEVKERLLAGEDIALTAVDNLPGIGKTALASVWPWTSRSRTTSAMASCGLGWDHTPMCSGTSLAGGCS